MRHVKVIPKGSSAGLRRQQERQRQWQQLQQKRGTTEEEFARIAALINLAHNLCEIQLATDELRAWVRDHPEEKGRLADVFSVLFTLEEGAREAQAEAQAMRLTEEEIQQRESLALLCRDVHGEDAPEVFRPALHEARRALEAWAACHPEDPRIPSLSAYLDMEEEMAGLLHAAP